MIAYTPPGFHVSPCDQVSFVVRHRVREGCTVEYEDLEPLFHSLPLAGQWGVSHGIVAAIIVALVIYLIMPPYVKLLAGWLFR